MIIPMKQSRVVAIIKSVVENEIPQEVVSCLVKANCLVVVNDLSDWTLSPSKHNANGKELLGVFGFENGEPIIGLNHKTLRTKAEVIKTTMHEVAHFYLHHLGLLNGERTTNKLVKQWLCPKSGSCLKSIRGKVL